MENILLVINIILALLLVVFVLIQKSEGGALGIGVSQDNFMFSRSAGNFLTKATAIIATLFIICSLALTIISNHQHFFLSMLEVLNQLYHILTYILYKF